MKKRLCACLLAVCLMVALLPVTSAAAAVEETGNCGAAGSSIDWTMYDNGTLILDGAGQMQSFSAGNWPWEKYKRGQNVSVHITRFEGGPNLKDIAAGAFSDCEYLESISIPDGVKTIRGGTFCRCTNLKNVTFPSDLEIIEQAAFACCKALEDISFPDSVKEIRFEAFLECENLKRVELSNSIVTIGGEAFYKCQNLENIELPDSLTEIGYRAFANCSNLKEIKVNPSNQSFKDESGVLLNKGGSRLIKYPAGKADRKYVLPDKVVEIDEYAFEGCGNLTSITFSNKETKIYNFAFSECSGLTDIYYPGTMTEWAENISVPSNCEAVQRATIHCTDGNIAPAIASIVASGECGSQGENITWTLDNSGTLTISGAGGMQDCSNSCPWSDYKTGDSGCSIKKIIIENGIDSIGEWVFYGCENLDSVTIPASVTLIKGGAFQECQKLSDIQYFGTKFQWEQIQIGMMNESLESATIHCTDGDIAPSGSGKPKYTPLSNGVKYVPYSCQVENPYAVTTDVTIRELLRYELEGTLPSGLSIDPKTSIISGIPMTDGTWNFQVKRIMTDPAKGESSADIVMLPRSVTILNNTDAAVQQPNDYDIIIYVGTPDSNNSNHFYKNEYTEEMLKIDGPYDEFYRLLIDGIQLREPEDYTSEEGSTVITIHAETFQRFGEGTHTIAAEYRPKDNPSQVKRVAQNYTLRRSNPSSGGNGSGGRSKPSINKNAQKPQTPQGQQQAVPFADIASTEWYYEDVVWAYQQGVMQGVDGTHFGPDEKVSQATIVTVLARLAQIDLSQFEGETEVDVPAGQYFTAAAIWAKRAGLMPSGGAFTGSEVTTRNEMAVMLTRYLASMGKDITPPAQLVTFEDAAGMSQEGNNAFQVLYQYGIFRGTGGMRMEPDGSTTRAQFVALMHRVYDTAVS